MDHGRLASIVFPVLLFCSCDSTSQDGEFLKSLKASKASSVILGTIDKEAFGKYAFNDPQKYTTPLGNAKKEALLEALESASYPRPPMAWNHPITEEIRWLYLKIGTDEWIASVARMRQEDGAKDWILIRVARPAAVLSWGNPFIIDKAETMSTVIDILK